MRIEQLIIAWGICLTSHGALGAELDLVDQQARFGWDAVSMIVRSISAGDVAGGDVQRQLRKAGIARLRMPMRVHASAQQRFRGLSDLGDCRWSYGVACVFTAEALVLPGRGQWGVQCLRGDEPVANVFLQAKVENVVSRGDRAIVHVEDMLMCWARGGDGVRLIEGRPSQSVLDPEFDGAPSVVGLDEQHVREVVSGASDAAVGCFVQSPRPNKAKGWVVLSLNVGPKGRVHSASIDQTTLALPEVERCLLGVMGGLTFHAPEAGAATVRYPLWFASTR